MHYFSMELIVSLILPHFSISSKNMRRKLLVKKKYHKAAAGTSAKAGSRWEPTAETALLLGCVHKHPGACEEQRERRSRGRLLHNTASLRSKGNSAVA
jgi:hypothetical protein